MKLLKILLTAPLIVFCFAAFAQQDTTKRYYCPMHKDMMSSKPGKCPKCGMDLNLSKKEKMKMETMKIYTCPMHANQTSNKPGKCPACGMKMTKKKRMNT
jgi:ssDNA-binding Zn-finger/Zn-ribbon topoisomerase 1